MVFLLDGSVRARRLRLSIGRAALLSLAAILLLPCSSVASDRGHSRSAVRVVETGRQAERRETLPITTRADTGMKTVLSVRLPKIRRGMRITFDGEVVLSTTCVEQISRCIGRSYSFDPHLEAQVVIAAGPRATKPSRSVPVSRVARLTCEQTRPNRNHHCPTGIDEGSTRIDRLSELPCRPDKCRLNMIAGAWHRNASANQVVVVGSDQPDGGVEGGKARLSAAAALGDVGVHRTRTDRLRTQSIPASFKSGKRVVYSQRIGNLEQGDALLIRSRQVSRIQRFPYFLSNQIVVSTRPTGTRPSAISRRSLSRSGTVTETTGFNCTLGRSAFQSPCVSVKSGIAQVERVPRTKTGSRKPLYANLVSRGFPKLAQARGSYPPIRVKDHGFLRVIRMRARP